MIKANEDSITKSTLIKHVKMLKVNSSLKLK